MIQSADGDAPIAFHLLAKPTGAICNLDCSYCYYLSKEMLYAGSRFRMADELLETYIRDLIEADRSPEVMISWQGGEPMLMGLEFFERSVRYAQKYRQPGTRISYTIQTNGTLLDDEWARFLKKHNFLVGISIDGPKRLHDAYRLGRNGQGTHDRVMRGIGVLQRHNVEYNTLTCLHQANADYPIEVYTFLRDECQSRFIQFIPVVERVFANEAVLHPRAGLQARTPGDMAAASWDSRRNRPLYVQAGDLVTARSVRPAKFGQFLIKIFDEWIQRDIGSVYVQMFDSTLANWVRAPSGMCVHSQHCGTALALEHNGDVYSCDHFVEPNHKLGNILNDRIIELVTSLQQKKFGLDKYDSLPTCCRDCDVRFTCHGGCPKDRFVLTADGEFGLNYLCEGYKTFFRHVSKPMRLMGQLLLNNRAPAEIMRYYASDSKSGTLPPLS